MSDLEFELDLDVDGLGELMKFVRELKMTRREFGLLDDEMARFSRQQRRMFRDANGRLRDQRGRFVGLGGSAEGASGSIMGAVGAGALLGSALSGIGRMALDAGIALARMGAQAALAFGKAAVEAAEFAQRQRTALGMLLKSDAAGAAAFDSTRKLAARLGLDVKATTDQFRELLAMQFSMSQATDIVKMSADMQALGADAQKVESTIRAITQVKGKGKLMMEELTTQLAEAGVSTDLVIKQLARMRKVGPDAIRKMISAGQIGADEGVQAIQLAVMEKLGIKRLGEAGEKFADSTIAGMKGKLRGAWENLWLDLGTRIEKPLMEAIGPIAKDLVAFFEGAEGKALVDDVVAGFKTLGAVVKEAWPAVKQMMGAFKEGFGAGLAGLKPALDAFKKALGGDTKTTIEALALGMRVLGFAIGSTVGAVLTAVGAFGALVGVVLKIKDTIAGVLTTITNAGSSLGTGLISGFVNGITAGAARVIAAVKGVATSAITAAKTALGVHSPSKEFAWMGQMTTAGFAQGIDASAPQASASMESMVAPPSVPTIAGGTTHQSVTFSPTIVVQGGDGSSTAEIEAAVRRAFEQALRSLDTQSERPS